MTIPGVTESQQTPVRHSHPSSGGYFLWRAHFICSPDVRWHGHVLELRAGRTQFGREQRSAADVLIHDPALSRSHAELQVDDQDVVVRDLASRNGLFVNGLRATEQSVGHGDVLRLGETVVVLERDHRAALQFETPTAMVPGRSEQARRIRADLALAAGGVRPALIVGPTGAGKEYAVAELHARSGRTGRLLRVNMASVSETLFEAQFFGHAKGAFTGAQQAHLGYVREAHGGTLMLDEIGDMDLAMQARLLRLLEERQVRPVGHSADVAVDVRYVAVTNADLPKLVEAGRFRHDILARLQAHPVTLPPICERLPDLLDLADVVAPLTGHAGGWRAALDGAAIEAVLLAPYPFNLRDLQAMLLRTQLRVDMGWRPSAALLASLRMGRPGGDTAKAARTQPLPAVRTTRPLSEPVVPQAESRDLPPQVVRWRPDPGELRRILLECHGNIEQVAVLLQRDRKQVYRWLEYAGISREEVETMRNSADPT
jgi:DNA-binding NtrC family response regulator